jgi:hypothetical protein
MEWSVGRYRDNARYVMRTVESPNDCSFVQGQNDSKRTPLDAVKHFATKPQPASANTASAILTKDAERFMVQAVVVVDESSVA